MGRDADKDPRQLGRMPVGRKCCHFEVSLTCQSSIRRLPAKSMHPQALQSRHSIVRHSSWILIPGLVTRISAGLPFVRRPPPNSVALSLGAFFPLTPPDLSL